MTNDTLIAGATAGAKQSGGRPYAADHFDLPLRSFAILGII